GSWFNDESLLGGRSFSSDITSRREAPSARGSLRSGEERSSEESASVQSDSKSIAPSTDSPLPFTSHQSLVTSHLSSDAVAGPTSPPPNTLHPAQTLLVTANGQSLDLHVTGTLSTGDAEDRAILVPLSVAQQLSGHPGEFRQLFVSALTKPADTLSERDPKSL